MFGAVILCWILIVLGIIIQNTVIFILAILSAIYAVVEGILWKKSLFVHPKESIAKYIMCSNSDFSEDAFLKQACKKFQLVLGALTNRDRTELCSIETEKLYNLHCQIINTYLKKGIAYHRERVKIQDSYLYQYYFDSKYEFIVVKIRADMADYMVNTVTGKIVKRNESAIWDTVYILTFRRESKNMMKNTICPNCGAPLNRINSDNECPYCKTIIAESEHMWLLDAFKGYIVKKCKEK